MLTRIARSTLALALVVAPGCAALGQATLGYTHDPWTGEELPGSPAASQGWLDVLMALVTGNPVEAVLAALTGTAAVTGGVAAKKASTAKRMAVEVAADQAGPSRAQSTVEGHEVVLQMHSADLAAIKAKLGMETAS